jgi:hypothetical protein
VSAVRGALRAAAAATRVAVDVRDLHWYGGLALAAFAPSWRLAVVGAVLALHALLAGVFAAWAAKRKGD